MSKRNVWLLIMSVFFGPLLGSVAFMIGTTLFDRLFAGGGPGSVRFLADYWPFVLSMGYALGCIPALVFAVVMAILSRRIAEKSTRLWVASLVGGVASGIVVGFFAFGLSGIVDGLFIVVAVVATGAIVGYLCMATIEWLHPLPEPAKAGL